MMSPDLAGEEECMDVDDADDNEDDTENTGHHELIDETEDVQFHNDAEDDPGNDDSMAQDDEDLTSTRQHGSEDMGAEEIEQEETGEETLHQLRHRRHFDSDRNSGGIDDDILPPVSGINFVLVGASL